MCIYIHINIYYKVWGVGLGHRARANGMGVGKHLHALNGEQSPMRITRGPTAAIKRSIEPISPNGPSNSPNRFTQWSPNIRDLSPYGAQ